MVLNIDSWGAGVKLIEMSKESDKNFANLHSISDGLAEVFGVSSSFHIAQLQVGLTKPIKLGRAKEITVSENFFISFIKNLKIYFFLKIKIKATCPVQVDGEPRLEHPCEIKITPHSQAKMLKYNG